MKKTTDKIRQDFLKFFKEKGHMIIPSSSLVPYNDSTLLFTNAGMNQFKEIFLGEKKSNYPRVATVQRCLRTGGKHNDLENVGYTSKHHTFFEMLGNFSFGDYFKKQAIEYAWELLTSKKWFNIPQNKLWISVYKDDTETYKIWNDIIKIPSERIIRIGDKNKEKYNSENFWQMGDTGPCGPCTEIFYDYSDTMKIDPIEFLENKNGRFVEIWNIVFIEFNRISKTKIISLKNKSIDTGMGLERISAVLQNVYSNYHIDVFQKLIKNIAQLSSINNLDHISFQVIADHIRSCSYIIADNILPSNEHRGYILRRIIRRALRHGHKIGIKKNFFHKLVSSVIHVMGKTGDILKEKQEKIENVLKIEEMQFSYTLEKGLKILNSEIEKIDNNILSGKTAFYLYDTFGFPIDLTSDVCREKNIKIDYNSYELAKEKQKEQSNINKKFYKNYNNNIILNDTCIFEGYTKTITRSLVKYIFVNNQSVSKIIKDEKGVIFLDKTPFYSESGGQIGDIGQLYHKKSSFIVEKTKKYGKTIGHIGKLISGQITLNDSLFSHIDEDYRYAIQLNHSATHLLHATLRKILGDSIVQKGSLVTNTYLRFDFSYVKSIDTSQIQKIENIINTNIRNNIKIKTEELNLEEAKKKKAMALFDDQYGSIVRVVFINNFSIELCGGTHTQRTGDIGLFKIISQSSVASGIKRIEAVTGQKAIDYLHEKDNYIKDISLLLNCSTVDIKEKTKKLTIKTKNLEKKIIQLQKKENTQYIKKILKNVTEIKGTKLLTNIFYDYEQKSLRMIVDQLKKELKNTIIILINIINNRFTIIVGVTRNLLDYITAIKIMEMIINKTNGKGGGKKEIAEGGGANTKQLPSILNTIKLWINDKLNEK
ncbi:alanine--tRNA ligase [Buchnera aphidicola]|uniref:alanine--tRNA ligase n=1 Tax=Buchnera aphidicola TaxID=9 RepID=UPI000189C569|nr:alanine--tRNA ligase [Buchnera aphidicola]ADP66794.1 alanyl-tRNA synthetase [Buchnera aphidicola str. TLW03 (Acyrthosiphon pisum)]ADP67888.1 alanyl-tRNA synthetase [Buchnera aphidicola str. JF98 (Acyrthosiphon pisum)]ACL30203.1 alanyl-tRNA synthetase [Buchnera aphidicola str. Tuc7 (Acyrthosiphon pisum)]ADP66222.1 alanyl-tRNA synthetase [Buchnera aphidicola str. LL01 (Acyrthosiphon pisum)]ADP67378.1 alanyl-tRNA synthetase [Buchnera aphidicola str. JF99 (Acyrthosiphon pisum)]